MPRLWLGEHASVGLLTLVLLAPSQPALQAQRGPLFPTVEDREGLVLQTATHKRDRVYVPRLAQLDLGLGLSRAARRRSAATAAIHLADPIDGRMLRVRCAPDAAGGTS